jgi:hypothetical protein
MWKAREPSSSGNSGWFHHVPARQSKSFIQPDGKFSLHLLEVGYNGSSYNECTYGYNKLCNKPPRACRQASTHFISLAKTRTSSVCVRYS